jgi:hypothetical protein
MKAVERGMVWVAVVGEWGGGGVGEEFASHGSIRSES